MNDYLAGWESPAGILRLEMIQLKEEGRDPQWIDRLAAAFEGEKADEAGMAGRWERLQAAPLRPDFGFVEPDDLEAIRAEREAALRVLPLPLSEAALSDRMYGAWLGRCCGCALGKPVELFFEPHQGLSSRQRIKSYLLGAGAGEFPLRDYFPGQSSARERTGELVCPASQREQIAFMETDDDIRYTVLAQKILLQHGATFTTGDVIDAWHAELPYRSLCTAETQAYRNYALRYRTHIGPGRSDVDWSWVATHQNPYREWIGAQIRADAWGYAAPGHPERAAEFGWRDARLSHVKNGLYGEMFVAAMIAAGFALDDPLRVVEAGLAEIPRRSRLHAAVREVIGLCRKHRFACEAFEKVFDEIEARFGHYSPVHTLPNAALVVAALLLGGNDFEKVITLAVMGGWDTDCNGATAGSIFGAMHGAGKIPDRWKAPLHDTLYAQIFDYHPRAISECARLSLGIAQKIMADSPSLPAHGRP